jgi:exodeoxyribonuclease VII small subunit
LISNTLPGHNNKGDVIMADKEMKLEESFEKLNHIMEELEKTDVSLEDSFTLYQEGMKLLKSCNDSIDKVEKELIILSESGEANEL